MSSSGQIGTKIVHLCTFAGRWIYNSLVLIILFCREAIFKICEFYRKVCINKIFVSDKSKI
jgi:hypothetical protein